MSNGKRIAIYGCGGLGREMLALIQSLEEWSIIGFYDDNVAKGTQIYGIEVKGGINEISQHQIINVVVAIGDPKIKEDVVKKLKGFPNILYPTLIHPSAILQDKQSIHVGSGTIITAGCILTTGISVGDHVLLNLNCTVGHDVVIDDYVSIMPGVNLAGKIVIGKSVLVGSGAQIIKQSRIGEYASVGSGSVVTKDVLPNTVVVGVPARVLKK